MRNVSVLGWAVEVKLVGPFHPVITGSFQSTLELVSPGEARTLTFIGQTISTTINF